MSITEQVIQKVKGLSDEQARELLDYLAQKKREEAEEERLDIEAARQALAEADKEGWIPWEQVKAEMKLASSIKKNPPAKRRKLRRAEPAKL